jgi:hypothetical protein
MYSFGIPEFSSSGSGVLTISSIRLLSQAILDSGGDQGQRPALILMPALAAMTGYLMHVGLNPILIVIIQAHDV